MAAKSFVADAHVRSILRLVSTRALDEASLVSSQALAVVTINTHAGNCLDVATERPASAAAHEVAVGRAREGVVATLRQEAFAARRFARLVEGHGFHTNARLTVTVAVNPFAKRLDVTNSRLTRQ
jgi:hypothetical protein